MSLKDKLKTPKDHSKKRNITALGALMKKQAGPMGSGKRPRPEYDDDYGDDRDEPMQFRSVRESKYVVWST
jgi:hypothetical protein